MKKKLFCFGDCHGFYNELKKSLEDSGFEPTNENHWLIGCGDYLDRGRQPKEIIEYLSSLERCILVRGNHEDLLIELLNRRSDYTYDWNNGTAQTILDLADYKDRLFIACLQVEKTIKDFVDKMVDYFETENYIFVHSSVPFIQKDNLPKYYICSRNFEYDSNWRNAEKDRWESARWGNPFDLYNKGILPKEKTIVFGHWSTSYMWAKDEGRSQYGKDSKHDAYFGKGFIGLDGTTVLSKKVPIVVLEDNFI